MSSVMAPQVVTYTLAFAVLALAFVILVLIGRVNRLTARQRGSVAGEGARPEERMKRIEADLDRLAQEVKQLRLEGTAALQRIGIVRYDAFRDMGGHLSVSIALLDNHRNGIVISILNGRDGSRGYAKAVREGTSASPLSEEEQQALAQALALAPAR